MQVIKKNEFFLKWRFFFGRQNYQKSNDLYGGYTIENLF
jgi:hypothetical protein